MTDEPITEAEQRVIDAALHRNPAHDDACEQQRGDPCRCMIRHGVTATLAALRAYGRSERAAMPCYYPRTFTLTCIEWNKQNDANCISLCPSCQARSEEAQCERLMRAIEAYHHSRNTPGHFGREKTAVEREARILEASAKVDEWDFIAKWMKGIIVSPQQAAQLQLRRDHVQRDHAALIQQREEG